MIENKCKEQLQVFSITSVDAIEPEFKTINWCDTTDFDSEDDYRTGQSCSKPG